MTRVAWCPFAVQDILRSGAGQFVNAPPKIVHHTTEGSSYAGASGAYKATGSLPHFTDAFADGAYRVWQHLPINQAATALKHPKGKPETNRANCIQIEHVGHAGRAHTFDAAYLLGIATLCRWIETETGTPRSAPFVFGVGAPRLSWEQWATFAGHFGHCHVPGNDHWDPGALDIAAILSAGAPSVLGSASPRAEPTPIPPPQTVSRGLLGGEPVRVEIVTIPTDGVGDGSVRAPAGFLSVSPAGSHDKYDDGMPEDSRDKDTLVFPIGARMSAGGWRIVVQGGPKNSTVGAPVLVAD